MLPHRYRKWLLLAASYYFYMSWNAAYVVLILFTTVVSYQAAILLEKANTAKQKKRIVAGAAFLCLAVLFIFKYLNFVLESARAVAGALSISVHPAVLRLMLPVGISFYTFQTLSYVIDVYRGDIGAEHDFAAYATFVSFFPQLVAGPIERTGSLLVQIKAKHRFDEGKAMYGAKLMVWGYFKKLVIADTAAVYVNQVYADVTSYSGVDLVLVMFLFSMQIYGDFSGYSDIALGTAKLLDIDLMTNFKSPYLSASVKEFWSRWHISLSSWFRDYVYIPLGGSRCTGNRRNMNLLLTFLASGLWHGASWTFVVWGGIHGIAQMIENACSRLLVPVRKKKAGHILSVCAVFIFCSAAWVFFRAETFSDAGYIFGHIFEGIGDLTGYFHSELLSRADLVLLFLYVTILAVYDCLDYTGCAVRKLSAVSKIWQWTIYLCIGLMIVFCSQKGAPTEFVYFQF